MTFALLKWAFPIKVGCPIAKSVLLDLAERANDKGECWQSRASISERIERSLKSTDRGLKFLAQNGFIEIQHRSNRSGHRTSSIYKIRMPEISARRAFQKLQSANHTPRQERPKRQGDAHVRMSKASGCPRQSVRVTVGPTVRVTQEPIISEPINEPASSSSGPRHEILGRLNGAEKMIIQELATWSNPSAPDLDASRAAVATQVRIFGADVVKYAFGQLSAEVASGDSVRSPMKLFPKICQRIKLEIERERQRNGELAPGLMGRGG